MTPATAAERRSEQTTDKTAIRPFQVNVPDAELSDLRKLVMAARLPDPETVSHFSQGVQLAVMQAVAR